MGSISKKLLRKKEYIPSESGFEKNLGAISVMLLGVGATIGAGIFVITGKAAATMAGPAIILAFIFSAITMGLSALVYAELGSSIPISGGAYSYTYTILGEFVAWLVGWNLILEYGLVVPAVSSGWSGYFRAFIENSFDFKIPLAISGAFDPSKGTFVDLFALIMSMIVFTILTLGIKKSASFNNAIVAIKFIVLALFIFVGFKHIDLNNISNFMPYGWGGVLSASSLLVFAYLGFDAVSTVAEETKNAQRNLPIGLIGSLVISTILYIVVSFVLVSMIPFDRLDTPDSLAFAMFESNEPLIGMLISAGAVITMTSVLIVMGLGLTRIVYTLSRDRLLPNSLATLHQTRNTPYKITIIAGVISSLVAGFISLGTLAELINIGTLFAYFMIGISALVFRIKRDDRVNIGFKIPFGYILLPINLICLMVVMYGLSSETWIRFAIWSLLGVFIYFFYGIRHSTLNKKESDVS